MVDPIKWLGEWEPIESVGKHDVVYPAGFAHGYKWRGPQVEYQPIPQTRTIQPAPRRKIKTNQSWIRSPQVSLWLEPERIPLKARILAWLRRAVR